MSAMPELKSPVAAAIEAHYEASETPRDSARIGASTLGRECEREIWYSFHWVSPHEKFDGRKLRLFQTGHREEVRMLEDLHNIGCAVSTRDPATGEQWEATLLNGVIVSKLDAKATNVPGAEKAEHIVECKTMNDKSFQDWRRKGLEKYSPVYWAQVQIGMMAHGIARTLFMATNKNTDEVETERVKYDPLSAAALVAKAERIARADRPPPKQEGFACRWCKHEKICRYDDWTRVNCRTCLHADLGQDGQWRCTENGAVLTLGEQKAGCGAHRFIPDLVPGDQVDVSGDIVFYKLRVDGADYADGVDAKPVGQP